MTSSVFALLDAEWRVLGRRPVPEAWPVEMRVDAGLPRLAAVVDTCRDGRDPVRAQWILAGVLAVAAAGDPLARRTAVQALLPAAAATAARLRGYVGWGPWPTRADLDGDAAAALAEVVGAGIPATAWPAAVVRSRVRDRLRTAVRRHARQHHREGAALAAATARAVTRLEDARCAEDWAARALLDAARLGVVSAGAAGTVLATAVCGWDPADVAARTGRDVRAVRTQGRRAQRRLALALAS
jgi:hypothetical protein